MPKRRRVPLRTCVSCGVKTDKRNLLRIVSGADDRVAIDRSGKRNGRGAYVCGSCRGSKGHMRRDKLERSLRTRIDETEWDSLVEAMTRPSEDVWKICTRDS